MQRRGDLMVGIWKFYEPQVSVEELSAFGEELAKDENFIHLYVRKTSTDQIGLGYAYKYSGSREDCERFKKEQASSLQGLLARIV